MATESATGTIPFPDGRTPQRTNYANASLLFSSNLVTTVVGTVGLVVIARRLGVSNYGEFAALTSFAAFFALVAEAGLGTLMVRDAISHPERRSNVFAETFALRWIMGAAASLAYLASAPIAYHGSHPLILLFFAMIVCVGGMGSMHANAFNVTNRFRALAIARVIEKVVATTLVLVAVWLRPTPTSAAAASVAASLFSWWLYRTATKGEGTFRIRDLAKIPWSRLRPAGWFAGTGIVLYLTGRASVAVSGRLFPGSGAGNYALGYNLAEQVAAVAAALMVTSFPAAVRVSTKKSVALSAIVRETVSLGAVGLVIAATGSLLGPVAIGILFGANYASAAHFFTILVWSMPFMMAAIPASLLADSTGNQWMHTINGLQMGVVAIGLIIALAPALGPDALGWAVFFSRASGLALGAPAALWAAKRSGHLR